jgi:quercetin dioxygenase-like cupin family protein
MKLRVPAMDRLAKARLSGGMSTNTQMIRPGDTVENPVTGERFTFTHTSRSTGGELLAFELGLRPGGAVPMPHVHPIQTERFEVVKRLMRFRVGLRKRLAGPGDVVEVAAGVMHSFANAGSEEARVLVEVRPALAMEEMFAEVVAMAKAGRMGSNGMPRNLRDLATLARKYDQESHASFLTVGLQRLLLAPLVRRERRRVALEVAA